MPDTRLSQEAAPDEPDLGNKESIYQPEQEGRIFPERPVFEQVSEEREHRKKMLVVACRAFADYGFGYGFAGHISVRDPEHPSLYWTNPMAVHFANVRLSNLILADHEGRVVEGRHAINRAGFILHAAVHEAHPDIVAMCHAHTANGTAFTSLGRPLDPISQDAACFYENHAVVSDDGGAVTVTEGQAGGVVDAFATNRAVLHQNHGLITASRDSVDDACWWFIALDIACGVQLQVNASGHAPKEVSPDRARWSAKHVGNDYIGWLHFQTILDRLLVTHPDMFE